MAWAAMAMTAAWGEKEGGCLVTVGSHRSSVAPPARPYAFAAGRWVVDAHREEEEDVQSKN
jgi:hypothetical protein